MQRDAKLNRSDAFHKLNPLCVNLIREQSKEHVAALRRVLKLVDDNSCQAFQEYVLLPLTLVFKNENKSEALILETIECVSDLLQRTSLTNWTIFSDVFLRLLLVVSSIKNGLTVSAASEEVKLAFTHGLQCLIKSAAPGILLQMLGIEFRPCLGHAVKILLELAEKERNRALQIASMECLADLACRNVQGGLNKAVLHYYCGNAFAGFLPGISIGLTEVIRNTEGRSQKTAAAALNTWATVIEEVLSDTHLNYVKQEADASKLDPQSTSVSKVQCVARTDDWVRSTAERLHVLVDRVLPCLSSSERTTKLAALVWASVILLKCKKSLEPLASPVLQLVLCMSADSDGKIVVKSSSLLEKVAGQMTQECLSLTEILEEDFYRALGRSPHIIWTGSEKVKLTHVKLLSGYLTIFRAKVAKILLSLSVCERLLNVLFLLTEFDTGTISLLAEHDVSPDFTETMDYELRSYHRQFKHFSDIDIFKEFVKVCKLLGQYGDINLLADILHKKIQGSATYRKQAILVLNHVLVSFRDNEVETPRGGQLNDDAYLRSLLEYYISQEVWNLPLQAEADSFDPSTNAASCILSIDKTNSNILQNCLLLEGVSIIASLMKQKFRPLLRICLCPLLEKADSSNHLVSQMACWALQRISQFCCYQSISQLIQENIDYITDALLFKLKHASSHPEIPHIVQALVKHGSRDAMGLVEDVGYEVLSALDFCHSENAMPFLRTLASIVHFVARWFPPDPNQEGSSDLHQPKSASSFVRFVEEYHRCNQISESLEVSEEQLGLEEGDDQNLEPIEEGKKEAPGHVKLLVQVKLQFFNDSVTNKLPLMQEFIVFQGLSNW